jgi:proton glutamate symport protein
MTLYATAHASEGPVARAESMFALPMRWSWLTQDMPVAVGKRRGSWVRGKPMTASKNTVIKALASKTSIILYALVLGVLAGVVIESSAPAALKGYITEAAYIIGTLWLNAMKMTVVPLVVALLITGVAQTAKAARSGALAGRAVGTMLFILLCSSVLAMVVLPLILAAFPMPTEAAAAMKGALASTENLSEKLGATPTFRDFILGMLPTNVLAAAADDKILPLIIFTGIFAFAVIKLPEAKRTHITGFFEALAETMIIIIQWVLALAAMGVFALAFMVGAQAGTAALGALLHYVVVLSSLGIIIWMASFGVAMIFAKKGLVQFFRAAVPAQAVAISTQSSLASLPAMLEGVKALGVRPATAEVVLPIAVAIFRATGPALNLGVALYIAHWYNIELTPMTIFVGILAGATTTLGAVSLPGSVSFVSSIAPICMAIGAPVEPLAILIAVETFPDIFRTLGNVTMDMAVTAAVDKAHDAPEE